MSLSRGRSSSDGFIASLPSIHTLPLTRRTLLVDLLRSQGGPQVGATGCRGPVRDRVIALIEDAIRRGDNVGADEFATRDRDEFDAFMSRCDALTLWDVAAASMTRGGSGEGQGGRMAGGEEEDGKLQAVILGMA